MHRRTLFPTLGVLGSLLGSAVGIPKAQAAKHPSFFGDLEARGTKGRVERLPSLYLESQQDFLTGFRTWTDRSFNRAAAKRINELCEANGIDPEANPSLETIIEVIGDDPVIGMSARTWISCQQLTWSTVQTEFDQDSDMYLAEMEATDSKGPGSLELNPNMELPDHVKHEIHIMPGGYVGEPLGGYVYHYGTNNFYKGRNNQDELHIKYAGAVPLPENGKVRRILEVGCCTGQMTMALKERFPDAEVWGIDAGGPMLRYGHMRAVDMGVNINLAQRLAEDTKFDDGYFDIVTSYILFHEMPEEISKQAVRETYRILRSGGVFFPIDFYTGSNRPSTMAYNKFRHWWDHRWNNEVWWQEYSDLDLAGAMRIAGFAVDEEGPAAWIGKNNLLGIKPV